MGTYLLDILEGKVARTNLYTVIESINDVSGRYHIIKKAFDKRGKELPRRTSHVVLLLNELDIIDITSEQFGLPNLYCLNSFKKTWREVSTH